MAIIKPFRAWRPKPESVNHMTSPPYDVIDIQEANKLAKENRFSFVRIIRPEVDFSPGIHPYTTRVYQQGLETFNEWVKEGKFIQDDRTSFYIYRIQTQDHIQTGVAGLASVKEYQEGRIKIHELTRPLKEQDRIDHISVTHMHAEPVFMTYKAQYGIDHLIDQLTQREPMYDFVVSDGSRHIIWQISSEVEIQELIVLFDNIDFTYVADGHHRTAAAVQVGRKFKEENSHHTGEESYNFFPAVYFPHDQVKILDYNRVVKDLHGFMSGKFLQLLERNFQVIPREDIYRPTQPHHMGLYLNKRWYQLIATPNTYHEYDPVSSLDVTILTKYILEPLLSIRDIRSDERIDFVGGIKGEAELMRRVDEGEMQLAFNLYPVTIDQIMEIADSEEIMPPKTSWFEPKLRSGLFVHCF